MPYILYTLAPNRAKYLTPDPDPFSGDRALAWVATRSDKSQLLCLFLDFSPFGRRPKGSGDLRLFASAASYVYKRSALRRY